MSKSYRDGVSLLHSEEYLDDLRESWWNADFLELLGSRFRLSEVSSLVDVGCGQGHWGRLVLPLCSVNAEYWGIDPEEAWLRVAEDSLRDRDLRNCHFQVGSAERLPFEDARFDLATCQTVLMHLADAGMGLREMVRVVRPGGLVVCAEPDTLRSVLPPSQVAEKLELSELLKILRLEVLMARGRTAVGSGDYSIGDKLPGLLAEAGLESIEVFLSDKAFPLLPGLTQDPFQDQEDAWFEQGAGPWDKDKAYLLCQSGGGSEDEFSEGWDARRKAYEIERALTRSGALSYSGGLVTYIASGRVKS